MSWMAPLASALREARRYRALERISLLYIALPFTVFAAGWLRPIVAIPTLAVTAYGLYRAQRLEPGEAEETDDEPAPMEVATYAVAIVAVVFVLLYSGTGGYAYYFGGQFRNDAFILDLMRHPWPLAFEITGEDGPPGILAFYIGNALVPSIVGALLGWAAALHFQFAWTCLGVYLAVCWFLRIVGRRAPQYVLLFLLFGGLDLVAVWIFLGPSQPLPVWIDLWMGEYVKRAPELGGMFWLFPSNVTMLFDSPHHVVCGWIAVCIVVYDAIHRNTTRRAGLVAALALLWSAFSFVGMAPVVLIALVVTRGRGMLSFENLAAGVTVLAITALYVGSNQVAFVQGPLWRFQNPLETGWILATVCVLEFGIYVVLGQSIETRKQGIAHPVWRWGAVACLLLMPWYRMGIYNDFPTKATIPSLLVLQLWLASAIAHASPAHKKRVVALVAVLALGTVSSLNLLRHSVVFGLTLSPPPIEGVLSTSNLGWMQVEELFAAGDGFFWTVLAKPPVYQPAPRPEPHPAGKAAK